MSELMKKQAINKKKSIVHQFLIRFDNTSYNYKNVPQTELKSIFSFLEKLSKYKSATSDENYEISPWRDSFKNLYKNLSGENAYKESAIAVKSARTSENLSQYQLAEKLGIRQSNLSKIENAKRPVGKILAKKLERIFNLNYKIFLSEPVQ